MAAPMKQSNNDEVLLNSSSKSISNKWNAQIKQKAITLQP
jgi:hypothetical protein